MSNRRRTQQLFGSSKILRRCTLMPPTQLLLIPRLRPALLQDAEDGTHELDRPLSTDKDTEDVCQLRKPHLLVRRAPVHLRGRGVRDVRSQP